MRITDHQAKYFAYELTKRSPSSSIAKLSTSIANAQIDLNPHQIEAALFAFKSPLSKGAILADEVGLGKTIEAGLVMAQKWAEKKRKILLIVPANLRKQWHQELSEKFFLSPIILETKSFNQIIKEGNLNPFHQEAIVICSYHFARSKSSYLNEKQIQWDLVVVDEAHRLRNVYKSSNKIAKEIKAAIFHAPKILLTATPLQNSLLELYGLVSIIDDHVFGDLDSFKANYAKVSREQDFYEDGVGILEPRQEKFTDLKERLKPVCIRTLRKQVVEYIKYTKRIPHTEEYYPSDDEIQLYEEVSEYLRRPRLFSLPNSQRQLITLVLYKLLASSSFAIADTLKKMSYRLNRLISEAEKNKEQSELGLEGLEENYEALDETSDEWIDDEEDDKEEEKDEKKNKLTDEDIAAMKAEKTDLEHYVALAEKIWKNSKGDALLTALEKGFKQMAELGGAKKAIIFSESRITQDYLYKLLMKQGYDGKIVTFNGTNTDPRAKEIYTAWLEKNKDTDRITGSKTADMRAALIDCFRDEAEIMIATEAGAEGINLQFCSLVINYDLPWNPQRIEQRIGRCHRYGQKHDVVVMNFINRKNAADRRIYELLSEKFQLFKGVFGASDEVLGVIESGVDFEKRIVQIYQSCRTEQEINSSFDNLQHEMETSIQDHMRDTRQKLLENFDANVHERLRINLEESREYLDEYQRYLWELARHTLQDNADFSETEYAFTLRKNPYSEEIKVPSGPYKIGKHVEDAHVFRPSHPLANRIIEQARALTTESAMVTFDYSGWGIRSSALEQFVGKSGYLLVKKLSIESLEPEDHILLAGETDDGTPFDQEAAKRMLSVLSPKSVSRIQIEKEKELTMHQRAEGLANGIIDDIRQRNSQLFDEELDKLEKWSDDKKHSLELDLKKLDIDIKTRKTQAKKIGILEEKVNAQKEIKILEKKRAEMRQELFSAQDNIELEKDALIERIERQLKEHTSFDHLFFIRWNIV